MYRTEQMIREAWDIVGPEVVGYPLGNEIFHTMGMNRALRVAYFEKKFGKDFPYADFEKKYKDIVTRKKRTEGIPVQEGLFELLQYLSNEKIPVVLATGSSSVHTYLNLAVTRTPNVFHTVICGDMVERSKPAPDIFLKACEELGVKPERAYAIEDSYNGIRAAHAGKLHPIMVPDLLPETAEMREKAEVVLSSLLEVISYLKVDTVQEDQV